MIALRWKKRHHGWAGFAGTSRKAVATVTRKAPCAVWVARCAGRSYTRCPTLREGKAWCERVLHEVRSWRPPQTIEALIVHADGRAELKAVVPMPVMMFDFLPKLSRVWLENEADMLQDLAAERVIYPATQWAQRCEFPMFGEQADERLIVYAHPKADPDRVRRLATLELRRRVDARNPFLRRRSA